ncbi:MAG: 2-phosphosulfolactate phosphatase [Candidatus Poribacteria bacterium]|nr:2-phosphosulfolactate phosphatase [Candidatus Poribacteria bacterium]
MFIFPLSLMVSYSVLNIDVAFVPEEICVSGISDKAVLIVDILRATSTITTAIANGASFIIPVNTPAEAFSLYEKFNREPLLGGEVDGKLIKGFHLGNSITEYTESVVKNKPIIIRTTNGTRAVNVCSSARYLAIGCFLNQSSCCRFLSKLGSDILIVCSGKEGKFGIEDVVFAGACVNTISQSVTEINKSDSAVAAEMLYQHCKSDILQMLRSSEHGRYLINIGLGDDLAPCAQVNTITAVPIYRDGKIIMVEGISL